MARRVCWSSIVEREEMSGMVRVEVDCKAV